MSKSFMKETSLIVMFLFNILRRELEGQKHYWRVAHYLCHYPLIFVATRFYDNSDRIFGEKNESETFKWGGGAGKWEGAWK